MNAPSTIKKLVAILLLACIACISHAAIVATATGTSFASTVAVASFTLNRPSSVNVGDLLVVQINFGSTGITVTTPTGWTRMAVDDNTGTGADDRQYVFYRVATAADTAGGSTSWSLTGGSVLVVAGMVGFRSDLTGRSIVIGNDTVDGASSSTTLTASSMTATAPGLLLRFFGYARGSTSFTSSTVTRLVDATTSGTTAGATLLFSSRAISGAGATGSDSVSAGTAARWLVHSLLLTESSPAKPATCYSDNFSSTTTFGQNWVTTTVGTNAFTPTVVGGRLRLTDTNGYEATGATLQRLFPTSNLIYVEFNHYAYNGSGADGIAITLSDSTITPQPGGFGGSLGYAARDGTINGFAGGWMGTALDEYGNYSNPTEGRNGGPGSRPDAVAIRGSGSGQTGYAYVAGTATLGTGIDSAASTTAAPGYRYRIIIDAAAANQTYVTVDRDTTGLGTSYTNLIPTFNLQAASGQATIPANLMLTFTGSSGGSTNVHEIGNLAVCASTINPVIQVDHFEFTYSTPALTCESASIQVKACADAACSTLMSVPVAVTLNPSSGWAGGNPITFTGSTTLQLVQRTPGAASFSVASSSPGAKPFSVNKCNGTNSSSCSLSFVDAGFSFDVPTLPANKPSGGVRLRAVRNAGDSSNSCVALFQNTTQSINFWSSYTTPNTGTRPVELSAVAGSGTFTNISGTSATPTALNLTFDANGETTFEARYKDAGLMALNASFTGGTTGPYANLSITGTDSFVSTPAGFCVRGATAAAPTTYLTCTSGFASCPTIAKAGNPFTLNIAAVAWESDPDADFCTGNGNTPNYSQSSLVLSSTFGLTPAQFGVAAGGVNGTVTPATVNIAAGSNGTVTLSTVTESEVGAFNFTVTPPALAYASGVTVPPGTSAIIGRFIPDHFTVTTGSTLTNRATSCASAPAFTYLGETLNLGYQVNALNLSNVITRNYQGIFAKLSTFAQMNTTALAPLPLPRSQLTVSSSATPGNPFSVAWTDGQATVVSPVTIAKSITPVGPYLSTAFGIAPIDSDGVTTTGFNLDTNAPADSINDHVQIGGTTELRYGRLRFDSVSGPANLSLSIPITVEYWNGLSFTTNTADSNCTTINSSSGSFVGGSYTGSLTSGETALSGSGTIINGQTTSALILSAPGIGNEGSVDVQLDLLANWPWLRVDWDGDGLFNTNVTATASFGTFRGSDRVIYWLETQ
jgi:MSHA biogenesis protein MshQ